MSLQQILISGGGAAAVTPISLVSSTAGFTNATQADSPAIITTGATLIVVGVASFGNFLPVISDSQSNTWTALTPYILGGTDQRNQLFYCLSPTTSATHTFQASYATAIYPSIAVAAFDHTAVVSAFDQQSGAASAATATLQPGSITPSANNMVLVACVTGEKATASIDSGFTKSATSNYQVGAAEQSAIAYLIQTTAIAVNPTWNLGSSGSIVASMASFKHV